MGIVLNIKMPETICIKVRHPNKSVVFEEAGRPTSLGVFCRAAYEINFVVGAFWKRELGLSQQSRQQRSINTLLS